MADDNGTDGGHRHEEVDVERETFHGGPAPFEDRQPSGENGDQYQGDDDGRILPAGCPGDDFRPDRRGAADSQQPPGTGDGVRRWLRRLLHPGRGQLDRSHVDRMEHGHNPFGACQAVVHGHLPVKQIEVEAVDAVNAFQRLPDEALLGGTAHVLDQKQRGCALPGQVMQFLRRRVVAVFVMMVHMTTGTS